jgi:DNA-binding NtrC family response regulator
MKTILILDSDSAQQKLMTQHLTTLGFAVRSVFSVLEFQELSEKPFTIILDEKMEGDIPGMQFLKAVYRKMRVPIVYMMSRPEKKSIADAKKLGAYEVIEKNSAAFINLRTTLDKLINDPPKTSWFRKLTYVLS